MKCGNMHSQLKQIFTVRMKMNHGRHYTKLSKLVMRKLIFYGFLYCICVLYPHANDTKEIHKSFYNHGIQHFWVVSVIKRNFVTISPFRIHYTGNENEFRRLIMSDINLNAMDVDGNTTLILATIKGDVEESNIYFLDRLIFSK